MRYRFLLIVTVIIGFTACNTAKNKESDMTSMLTGKWQMDALNLDASDTFAMDEAQKEQVREELKIILTDFEMYKSNMQIIFGKDNKYTFIQPTDTATGTWTVLPNDTVVQFIINGFEDIPQYENIRYVDENLLQMYDSNARAVLHFKRIP